MDIEHDLFGVPIPAERTAPGAPPEPLAVPCGYRNRRNAPCLRLAQAPLRVDGRPLRVEGRPLLRCDLRCFDAPGEPQDDSAEDREPAS